MSELSGRKLNLLTVLAASCILAACATTNTDSQDASSTETEIPAQFEPEPESVDVIEAQEDEVETLQIETQTEFESMPTPLEAELASESAGEEVVQTEVIEETAVFPDQSYEIEEPLEFESDSDAEIDRLREELAASEAELDRNRARETEAERSRELEAELERSRAQEAELERSLAIEADAEQSRALEAERVRSRELEAELERSRAREAEAEAEFENSLNGAPDTDFDAAMAQASEDPESDAAESTWFPPGKPVEYSIYFGYNQASLELEFETTLTKHAEYLKANPDLRVEVQGNCDERGSREFNIALGSRRARTVKRALELLGIDGDRIEVVSFGSEKPVAFGHDEESWRLNRRADIVY